MTEQSTTDRSVDHRHEKADRRLSTFEFFKADYRLLDFGMRPSEPKVDFLTSSTSSFKTETLNHD